MAEAEAPVIEEAGEVVSALEHIIQRRGMNVTTNCKSEARRCRVQPQSTAFGPSCGRWVV